MSGSACSSGTSRRRRSAWSSSRTTSPPSRRSTPSSALYREDLARDFRFRLADVDNVLNDFEKRGADFFEDTLRIGRIFDLMNQSR